eukprot:Opistho-2@49096
MPVLEYQLQQYRLIPYLAGCYAIDFFYKWLSAYNFALEKADTKDDRAVAELHALASAGKSVSAWISRDAIQTSRECCGGHGYSAVNGLGRLRDDNDPNLTYEGDNNVLMQQTAKYIVGALRKVHEGKPVTSPLGTTSYASLLADGGMNTTCDATEPSHFAAEACYLGALRYRAAWLLQKAGEKLSVEIASGKDMFTAWNDSQVFALQAAARAYIDLVMTERFLDGIERCNDSTLVPALRNLCAVFALWRIESDLFCLRDAEYINSDQGQHIRDALLVTCRAAAKDAVCFVDAVAPPDAILFSPIGRSDGEAYLHLYQTVLSTPGAMERPKWWADTRVPAQPRSLSW